VQDHAFEYGERAPAPALAPHVRCFWFLRAPGPDPAPQLVVPDGCMELVVQYGAAVRQHQDGRVLEQPRAMLMGELRRPVLIESTGAADMLGVRFAPGAARLFFDPPMEELVDRMAALDAVLDGRDRPHLRRLLDEERREARLLHFQNWLLSRLRAATPDRTFRECVRAMLRARGAIGLSDLQRSTGLGERQLQRRFLSSMGITAKSFARVVRFREVLGALTRGAPDWADMALECGYYDQAHLIRDFRTFTGRTPQQYVAHSHPLSDAFSSGWDALGGSPESARRVGILAPAT
jgi:AraC-like DNA-binding protein